LTGYHEDLWLWTVVSVSDVCQASSCLQTAERWRFDGMLLFD